jgi:hypothetical protein
MKTWKDRLKGGLFISGHSKLDPLRWYVNWAFLCLLLSADSSFLLLLGYKESGQGRELGECEQESEVLFFVVLISLLFQCRCSGIVDAGSLKLGQDFLSRG